MGQAIGNSLVLAVGVAISPIPIVAVVLLLTTPRARANGPAFLIGWVAGLGIVGTVVLALAGPANASTSSGTTSRVAWLNVVLGATLVMVAVRRFRARPGHGDEPSMPKWMGAIDGLKPPMVLAVGAGLAVLNPKNLLLAVAGAAAIAQTGISGPEQAVAYVVFALIATVGVAAPVVIFYAMGSRAHEILQRLKTWMAHNNAVIMAILCLVIGAKLIGDGISALSG